MTKCQITCNSLQKSSKCQIFLRVWHLVIFRADQSKKPPCIMYSYYISCLFCFSYFAIIHRNHPRPSLPSDVLIALAVRNLDPSNQLVIHSDLMCPIIPLVAKSSNLWIRFKYGAVYICQKIFIFVISQGASFTHIIAFLSLHFPYFNKRLDECRNMVG